MPEEHFRFVMEVNFHAVVAMCKRAIPLLQRQVLFERVRNTLLFLLISVSRSGGSKTSVDRRLCGPHTSATSHHTHIHTEPCPLQALRLPPAPHRQRHVHGRALLRPGMHGGLQLQQARRGSVQVTFVFKTESACVWGGGAAFLPELYYVRTPSLCAPSFPSRSAPLSVLPPSILSQFQPNTHKYT